jgi:hypothetical protein
MIRASAFRAWIPNSLRDSKIFMFGVTKKITPALFHVIPALFTSSKQKAGIHAIALFCIYKEMTS